MIRETPHPVGDPIPAPATIAYGLTSTDAYFGTYQGTCALPLRGDVDLVRLWRGPLAPDFVGTLADAALAGPSPSTPPATPSPESVPVATGSDSAADAPASRSALAPIAPGIAIAAGALPASGSAPAKAAPGAPARACSVSPSTKRLRVGRRTSLTVRVALRGKPLNAAKVVATEASSRRRLASAKTARDGRARRPRAPAPQARPPRHDQAHDRRSHRLLQHGADGLEGAVRLMLACAGRGSEPARAQRCPSRRPCR